MNTCSVSPFDLIAQAPTRLPVTPELWAKEAQAEGWEEITSVPSVYRFRQPRTPEAVMDTLKAAGFDVALVPCERRIRDVGVLAMDMDSTLITIECVDEIAGMIGIKDRIAAITERAMRGELDFRASLTERVGLLAGVPVSALEAVYATRLNLSPGAALMVRTFQDAGAKTLLVSGGFTFFTDRLQQRLGLTQTASNELEIIDGKLTGRILGEIVDAQRKANELAAMKQRWLTPDKPLAVAVGDGANDLPMLKLADVSFAYHAKPVVRTQATHAIEKCGLDAMVRCFR